MTPRLSIVIPVLNRARLVGRAIASVLDQQVPAVEVIAVDGGSTDGTPAAIASFAGVRLLHAPKSSVYEALNIGIEAAQAPVIGHLNSDDRILSGALDRVIAATIDPQVEIVRGKARFVAAAAHGPHALPAHDERAAPHLDLAAVLFGVPAINCCFTRASTYRRIGRYDERLRIAADREWLLRALLAGVAVRALDYPVYEYLVHPASLTISAARSNEAEFVREHLQIAESCLVRPQTTSSARLLRAWHAHEVARLLLCAGADRRLGSDIAQAFRISPAWPLRAIAPVARTAARRLRRATAD